MFFFSPNSKDGSPIQEQERCSTSKKRGQNQKQNQKDGREAEKSTKDGRKIKHQNLSKYD